MAAYHLTQPFLMHLRSSLRLALAALLLAGLARCAGNDLARNVPSDKVSTSSRDAAEAASLISQYRVAHGLSPVAVDSQLNGAAVYQARAVAEAGTLSHGAFASRMDSFHIGGASAENLSAGSDSVAGAIARWKASPGHNQNLLMAQVRRIGLARADSPGIGYKHYWALVLAQ
jgi:uncharacterized protein YkwD